MRLKNSISRVRPLLLFFAVPPFYRTCAYCYCSFVSSLFFVFDEGGEGGEKYAVNNGASVFALIIFRVNSTTTNN